MSQKSNAEYFEVDRVLARKAPEARLAKKPVDCDEPKKKRGPVKMAHAKIVVNLDKELYEVLHRMSLNLDRSMSWIVRDAMRKQYALREPLKNCEATA